MIQSDKYKFLFFELPRTGTTSIRNVLLNEEIGFKYNAERHISISEYSRKRDSMLEEYTVICGVRNPMDRVLSLYLKMQRDHNEYFSKLEKREKLGFSDKIFLKRYLDIKANELSFEEYFLKYFKTPYTDWMYRDVEKCDILIRFENLEDDYHNFLSNMGVEDIPTLPVKNKVEGKKGFEHYYSSSIRKHAFYVFSIYMEKFGYEFPDDWSVPRKTLSQKMIFRLKDSAYHFYKFVLG